MASVDDSGEKPVAKKAVAKKAAVAKQATAGQAPPKKAPATKKAPVKKATAKKTPASSAPEPAPIDVKDLLPAEMDLSFMTNFDPTAEDEPAALEAVEIVETVEPAEPVERKANLTFDDTAPLEPVAVAAAVSAPPDTKKMRSSTRVVFSVAAAIVVIALALWAKSNGPSSTSAAASPSTVPTPSASAPAPSATATPTPSATATATATPTASATTPSAAPTTATTSATDLAPRDFVAQYSATGLTLYWFAPATSETVTGYKLEIAYNGGNWQPAAEIPATDRTFDVTKNGNSGWTSFRLSSVYASGKTVAAKAFGMPGQYS